MEDQHTPGPWKWVAEGIMLDGEENEIRPGELYDEPDACLIAAAPDMLALLRSCLWEHMEFNLVSLGTIDNIRRLLESLDNPTDEQP